MKTVMGVYLYLVICAICVLGENSENLKSKTLKHGKFMLGETSKEFTLPNDKLSFNGRHEICTDCPSNINHQQDENKRTIRHGKHKVRKHGRHIQKSLSAPFTSKPLQILFKTYVNDQKVLQLKTSSEDMVYHNDDVKINKDDVMTKSSHKDDVKTANGDVMTKSSQKDDVKTDKDNFMNKPSIKDDVKTYTNDVNANMEDSDFFLVDDDQDYSIIKQKQSDKNHNNNNKQDKSDVNRPKSDINRPKSDHHYKDKLKDQEDKIISEILKDSPPYIRNLEPYKPYRRLENVDQKLYNRLEKPMKSIFESLDDVLEEIVGKTHKVCLLYLDCKAHQTSELVFNGTRFVMMSGVRDVLNMIHNSKSIIYGAVVDISRLTRTIYLRLHQRRAGFQPTDEILRNYGNYSNFGMKFQSIARDSGKYQKVYGQTKMMKMKMDQIEDRIKRVRDALEENTGRSRLVDLIYQANNTRIKLVSEFNQSLAVRKFDRYLNMLTDVKFIVRDSRTKLEDARILMHIAAENTRGNLRASGDRKAKRTVSGVDGGLLAPVSIVVSPYQSDSTLQQTAVETKELKWLSQSVDGHIRYLQSVADQAKRLLQPLITRGNEITRSPAGGGSVSSSPKYVTRHIINTIKKLYDVLVVISYKINYDAQFVMPCVFRDSPGDECLGKLEGSAEGSGDFGSGDDEDGANPETDTDFKFEETPDTDTSKQALMEIQKFGNKLTQYSRTLRKSTVEIKPASDYTKKRVSELSGKWNTTKQRFESTTGFQQEFHLFSSLLKQTADTQTERHRNLLGVVQTIKSDTNQILHNTTQLEKVAADIKQKFLKLKSQQKNSSELDQPEVVGSGDGSDDDGSEDDDEDREDDKSVDVTSLRDKVKSVKSKWSRVEEVFSGHIQCQDFNKKIRTMKSSILQLKQKVFKARLLLSTLQLPVTVDTKSLIESYIPARSENVTITTDITVCIQPASLTGPFLHVKGNHSISYVFELKDGLLDVVVRDKENTEVEKISLDKPLNVDQWYTVKLSRIGYYFDIEINTTTEETLTAEKLIPNIELYQPQPGHVYIGGDPIYPGIFTAAPNYQWSGCVSGLSINNNIIPLYLKTSTNENPRPCASNCARQAEKHEENVRFEGNGFIEFPPTVLPQSGNILVSIEFKTKLTSAFIMSVVDIYKRLSVDVFLINGQLIIRSIRGRLHSQKVFNDNKFHTLEINLSRSSAVRVDGNVVRMSRSDLTPQRANCYHGNGIVLGGRKVPNIDAFCLPDISNFIGCLRNLKINNDVIKLDQLVEFDKIQIGTCQSNSFWSNCLKMDGSSKALEFKDLKKIKNVWVTISSDSNGTLLQFTKSSKFNLTLSVTDRKLHIRETVKDHTATLDFLSSMASVPISIEDNISDKTLKITILEKETSMKYGTVSGGWWYSNDDDDEDDEDTMYNIIISPSIHSDKQTSKFNGGMSHLIINDRLEDLEFYRLTHGLKTCTHPRLQLQHRLVNKMVTDQVDRDVLFCHT